MDNILKLLEFIYTGSSFHGQSALGDEGVQDVAKLGLIGLVELALLPDFGQKGGVVASQEI